MLQAAQTASLLAQVLWLLVTSVGSDGSFNSRSNFMNVVGTYCQVITAL